MVKKSIIYGALTGLITVIYSLILYVMGIETFSNFWLFMLLYPIIIFCMFFFAIKVRKEVCGNLFKFSEAFTSLFLIGVATTVVSLVWSLLLFNVIDTELQTTMPEMIMLQTEEMMTNMGAPQNQIDDQMVQLAEDLPKGFTVMGQLIANLKGLIFYAVIALIGALIIRKSAKNTESLDAR